MSGNREDYLLPTSRNNHIDHAQLLSLENRERKRKRDAKYELT